MLPALIWIVARGLIMLITIMENTTKSSINILFSWLISWSQVPYFWTMISEKKKKTVKLLFSFPHGMQDDEISGYSFHKQNIFSNYFIFKIIAIFVWDDSYLIIWLLACMAGYSLQTSTCKNYALSFENSCLPADFSGSVTVQFLVSMI